MSLRWAYNTNGLSSHRLDDALALLADHGYAGVALTLDVAHHDPFAPDLARRTAALAERLRDLGLASVVETGARFLLDPRRKHHPTLVSADASDRARRIDFLRLCVDVAADLGSEAVSFWAGVLAEGLDPDEAWKHLVHGVASVAGHARWRDVPVAVEPEPGMLVDDLDDWSELQGEVPDITLALDTGHCIVSGRWEPADAVRAFAPHLGAVAVEDMPRGVHDHRTPGEGDMDLPAVVTALRDVGHRGLVSLELSRDSHRADRLVPEAIATLRAMEGVDE
ncbi:sugar phosphate isomerase/epimerase family protein [Actinomycetospora termitidis]|uniref:Sugar phosphate isomerase/epimerase family protein n=1 Tax=Actinomycetospora termitidis TaxID=3053470 RepID=A0ABT7M6N1_9PSEU|nr:sugar phosphate isomerase/epimerase family protein [Actinomycetospora sp. Odt1-22]MDL5156316.1 sugar phosphate isomerase/epimerase family protein [Actinomycetospora sp. Odt1-22]